MRTRREQNAQHAIGELQPPPPPTSSDDGKDTVVMGRLAGEGANEHANGFDVADVRTNKRHEGDGGAWRIVSNRRSETPPPASRPGWIMNRARPFVIN